MRALLEVVRIIVIFTLFGGLGWGLIHNSYTINETTESFSWMGACAILLILFVWYRNKLQFSGWYKKEGGVKLSKRISLILIVSSVVLFILPFVLGNL
ncbi:hypothetical protein SAMN05216353_13924 [Halobacillus alkaliphilus]|uniref:Uncharacterized protein n=1 Tax=Halobacillus alkaliphilus TaxID=396056 RepID=A0A1I2RH35_9BACI|nr:hypothetical protein SAMN05216353_13924 [Halobacillus alkaliphilus]